MPRKIDCTYAGYDAVSRAYHVHEQLYPESRGFIVHSFASEEQALAFIAALPASDES